MMLQRVKPWRTSGIIVIILAVGHSSNQDGYACLSTKITNNFVRLHFNTTLLSGVSGGCSCKFGFLGKSYIQIDTMGFMIQNCTDGYPAFTVITRQTFAFTCNKNKIGTATAQELLEVEHNAGDILWLIVSKSRDSPVYSGIIATKSWYTGADFSVICYEPNENIPSVPTTQEIKSTSTISMTFSTDSSSITSSTDPSISNSATSVTSASTPIPEITFPSSRKSHENSTYSEPSKVMSTMEPTVGTGNQLGNKVPVPAIAGGAAGAVVVVMIIFIVVGVTCYRKKKSTLSTEKENETDINLQDLNRMNAVHDNDQPNSQDLDQSDSMQSNTDQSKAFDSERVDPEGLFTENALYESSAKSQISALSKSSDFTVGHETASSGDVYAVVWK